VYEEISARWQASSCLRVDSVCMAVVEIVSQRLFRTDVGLTSMTVLILMTTALTPALCVCQLIDSLGGSVGNVTRPLALSLTFLTRDDAFCVNVHGLHWTAVDILYFAF